jgi:hypothetical protein
VTEDEFNRCTDPQKMLAFLRGRVSDRRLRLFASALGRRVWPLLTQKPFREAVEVAERFADGLAGLGQLRAVLGEAADDHDWLGGVGDVAYHAARPPGAFGVADASRASRLAAAALAGAAFPAADFEHDAYLGAASVREAEAEAHASLLRCLLGPLPFRPVTIPASVLDWNSGRVVKLATATYEEWALPSGTLDSGRLAVLADTLEAAGLDDQEVLQHLREQGGVHVRGCWCVDLVLGRQ